VRHVGLVAEVHAAQCVCEVGALAHVLLHEVEARAVAEHHEQVGVAERRRAARAHARAISRPGEGKGEGRGVRGEG
jgi:hypothetical protein